MFNHTQNRPLCYVLCAKRSITMGRIKIQYTYKSPLSVEDCRNRICCYPRTFGSNIHNLENYECIVHSETQMTVIFTGCQFGGMKRTEYLFTFEWNGTKTVIVAKFQRELLFFLPYTSTYQLDIFMKQKVEGYRAGST